MKDITLSDGTFIPEGTVLAVATHAMHHDNATYPNADEFDPFRFARMREGKGEGEDMKHQFTTTSVDCLTFGHGTQAWYVVLSVQLLSWTPRHLTAVR